MSVFVFSIVVVVLCLSGNGTGMVGMEKINLKVKGSTRPASACPSFNAVYVLLYTRAISKNLFLRIELCMIYKFVNVIVVCTVLPRVVNYIVLL